MNTIRRYAADDAHVIFGTAYDDSLGDQLRVTVIATGLSPAKRQQPPISIVHSNTAQRTGTDNLPVLNTPVLQNPAAGGQPHGGTHGTDFAALATPSVWRNGRSAAAKLDALTSAGVDEIEIPAFLRRQAD